MAHRGVWHAQGLLWHELRSMCHAQDPVGMNCDLCAMQTTCCGTKIGAVYKTMALVHATMGSVRRATVCVA
jgi:hypothetical protein